MANDAVCKEQIKYESLSDLLTDDELNRRLEESYKREQKAKRKGKNSTMGLLGGIFPIGAKNPFFSFFRRKHGNNSTYTK